MNRCSQIMPMKCITAPRFFLCLYLGILLSSGTWFMADLAEAVESLSRTETNCTIGMAKGKTKAECQVPIPNGCTVAQFPGYDEPWAEATKGGATSCQFDTEKTDWKTSIWGTCQACKTDHCTGRFTVMFNCLDNIPPANPGNPPKK